jgi:hypothetical protein
MPNITIKTNSPSMALGLTEGAAAVELRAVKAENKKLHAKEGVRAIADEKRWQKTRRKLAKKYSTKPVGRVRGAILGVWGLLWLEVAEWRKFFADWNRER